MMGKSFPGKKSTEELTIEASRILKYHMRKYKRMVLKKELSAGTARHRIDCQKAICYLLAGK